TAAVRIDRSLVRRTCAKRSGSDASDGRVGMGRTSVPIDATAHCACREWEPCQTRGDISCRYGNDHGAAVAGMGPGQRVLRAGLADITGRPRSQGHSQHRARVVHNDGSPGRGSGTACNRIVLHCRMALSLWHLGGASTGVHGTDAGCQHEREQPEGQVVLSLSGIRHRIDEHAADYQDTSHLEVSMSVASSVSVREATSREATEWDSIVKRFPNHRITHLTPWINSLVDAGIGKPLLLVTERDGDIVACTPGLLTRLGPLRLFGSPLPGWQTLGMGP